MRIASYRKKSNNIKILLWLCLLFIIISNNAASAQSGEQRDPFLSLADRLSLKESAGDILPFPVVLNGIIWTKDMPLAMVNNEIVGQGQEWRGFKIEKIEKDKLILKRQGTLFEIPLVTKKEGKDEEADK